MGTLPLQRYKEMVQLVEQSPAFQKEIHLYGMVLEILMDDQFSQLVKDYVALSVSLYSLREDTGDTPCAKEDQILDEMERLWYKMSDEEHKQLDALVYKRK